VIVETTQLPGVLHLKPRVYRDARGHFLENWRADAYAAHGIGPLVQDNTAASSAGVLRGLHFQHPQGQGKLVSVAKGRVFDVAVDVRRGSPTFGRWMGIELDAADGSQLWIPAGFAHGYAALTDAVVSYKCTDYYAPECERVIRWNDPAIGINWPVAAPLLAPRDANAPLLADLSREQLP
jgi:dTDP-4-dehydrorhamnose 3,5-epimerase